MHIAKIALAILVTGLLSVSASFADISKARNFYQFDDKLLTAGQPAQGFLEAASDDGIEVVINIVRPSEGIYNPMEQEILEGQGIEYFHTPINWSSPTDEQFDAFIAAMDQVGDRKVLVHCWGNARASAMVTAFQAIHNKDAKSAAMANIKQIWDDVAGYSFGGNKTWQKYIARNIKRSN